MQHFLSEYYTKEEIILIEESQKARINTQYYSNRNISEKLYKKMINNTHLFFIKSKEILNHLTEKEIKEIKINIKSV